MHGFVYTDTQDNNTIFDPPLCKYKQTLTHLYTSFRKNRVPQIKTRVKWSILCLTKAGIKM